jgi:predicted small lipoprotein YifL
MKGEITMKKFIAIFAVVALMLSASACGKKNKPDNSAAPTSVSDTSDGSAAVDDDGNEIKGTAVVGAGDEVDMKKVEGDKVKAEKRDNEPVSGTIAGLKVGIGDAKVMQTEQSKIFVVTFDFKNTTGSPLAFDNIISVDVTQNGSKLMPTVITNMEGINILSGVEAIESGKSTTVQKTYILSDDTTPVEVTAYKYAEASGDSLNAVFNLK